MTKVCTKCGVEKELTGFHKDRGRPDGLRGYCKVCGCAYRKKYYDANVETCRAQARDRREKNLERCLEYNREYKKKNKAKLRKYHNEYLLKRLHDPEDTYKIGVNLRTRLYQALKKGFKNGSAVRDLGCSIEEFKLYIENQFYRRPDGTEMTWGNYGGEWHLDHVVPLAKFDLTNRTEFLEACNYLNIQPLWAEDNLRKGAK